MQQNVKLLVLISIMLIAANYLYGAYLSFEPVELNQPDGTKLNLFATGDEFYNWLHDKDGYTIKQNNEGWYVYLDKISKDELVFTDQIVGIDNPRNRNLVPWINISPEKMGEIRKQVQSEMRLSESGRAPTSGTLNNLVVFIRFSDQSEFGQSISTYSSLFNGLTGNTMQAYYKEVSYDQLNISTTFYPTPTSMVVSWQDTEHTRNYFVPYSTSNTIGYIDATDRRIREHTLLAAAVNGISSQVPASLNLDGDNDGLVDNVCFIIQGATTAWATLLWPHRWSLSTVASFINGKRVLDYNFQLSNSLASSGNGVLCHEMFHSLGAPDLYHYTNNGITPVGSWDLMQTNSNPPEHMCAFMKYKYGHWIPEIPLLENAGSYSINYLMLQDNNCYRINSPNSSSEYFVVEFRKKTGQFENSLPGTGMLIYRINTACGNGNADGPPDEVYLYRLNGTPSSNGTVSSATFSTEVGRTSFNNITNPRCFLSEGENGNISISSIGSSSGTSISFYLNYIPPRNLTAVSSHASVALNWEAPGFADPSNYKLFRDGVLLTTTTDLSYTDTDVINGINYSYYVKAVFANPAGESEASNSVSGIPSALPPRNLSGMIGNASCILTWQAPLAGTPTGYKVYRNSVLRTTTVNLTFTDYEVINNMTYSYSVKAVYINPTAESSATNYVSLTPNDGVVLTVGTGSLTNQGLPMMTTYKYSYSQSIYLQNEINLSNRCITKLYWQYTGGAVYTDNIKIYMGHTGLSSYTSSNNWVPLNDMTLAYDGTITTSSASGWIEINLSTPFFYNNTQNLVIAFDENSDGFESNAFYCSTATGNRSLLSYSDTVNPDPASPPYGYLRGSIPNIRFFMLTVSTPTILTSPISLDFGEVCIGTTSEHSFVVQNIGDENLTGIISTPVGCNVSTSRIISRNSLDFDISPDENCEFTITYSPTTNQIYNEYVTITSNDPFNPITYISVTGIGYIPPTLELSSISITENLALSSSSNQTVFMQNTGNRPLTYSIQLTEPQDRSLNHYFSSEFSSSEREITWLLCSSVNGIIDPGQTQELDLFFVTSNTVIGTHHAVININSNDPANPVLSISVVLNVSLGTPDVQINENTNSMQLSWDTVPGANAYKIYRCYSFEGVYQLVDTVNQLAYTESNVTDCAFYKVVAVFE